MLKKRPRLVPKYFFFGNLQLYAMVIFLYLLENTLENHKNIVSIVQKCAKKRS